MNKNLIFTLGYVSSILLYLYLISIVGNTLGLGGGAKIITSLIGVGGLTYILFRLVHLEINRSYRHIAQEFNGKVEGKYLFSKKKVHFAYKSYEATMSYTFGGKGAPSTTDIFIQTNFPEELKIEITYQDWIYTLLKRTRLENPDISFGDDEFNEKFKLEIEGRDKAFLMSVLSPDVRDVLLNILRKGPKLYINGPDFEFHINEIILNKDSLKEFYTFAFLFVDHVDNLLNKESETET